ncbi:MAG: hypothetical protein LBV29_03065 [Azoarcus sp.]|jgi:hypothetical protein|nr:hypothetical protein [Azoarcus sp.]
MLPEYELMNLVPEELYDVPCSMEVLVEYARAIEAAVMPKWLPISEAPMDGTVFFAHESGALYMCFWLVLAEMWYCPSTISVPNPTHWMPLPPMPEDV